MLELVEPHVAEDLREMERDREVAGGDGGERSVQESVWEHVEKRGGSRAKIGGDMASRRRDSATLGVQSETRPRTGPRPSPRPGVLSPRPRRVFRPSPSSNWSETFGFERENVSGRVQSAAGRIHAVSLPSDFLV